MVAVKTKPVRAQEYKAKDVEVTSYALEGPRKAPGMYIGGTDSNALFTALREIIDNAIDEGLAGRCKTVDVIAEGKGFYVVDDGQGIPVDIHPKLKKSTLTVIFTELHAGTKTSGKFSFSRGVHGVGVSVTNALSKVFTVWTFRKGQWYTQTFSKGLPQGKVQKTKAPVLKGKRVGKGTVIYFEPDYTVFQKDARISLDDLRSFLRINSYLNPKLTFTLTPENGKSEVFRCKEGLSAYLQEVVSEENLIGKEIIVENDALALAICWNRNSDDEDAFRSFVNGVETTSGGTHVAGFYSALAKSLEPYSNGKVKLTQRLFQLGLHGILNVYLKKPQFKSQIKNQLASPIQKEVEDILLKAFDAFWKKNKGFAKELVKFLHNYSTFLSKVKEERKALREIKPLARNSIAFRNLGVYAAASSRREKSVELFLVEGKSAYGPAKSARDAKYQDVLALKGKPINAITAPKSKVYNNDEVKLILQVMGFNANDPNWFKKSRIKRVIILSDADDDGQHIAMLLYALFFQVMPEVINAGALYKVTDEALFKSYYKGEYHFGKSFEDVKKKVGDRAFIQRVKGWGEINSHALRFIALNPATRKLLKIEPPKKEEYATLTSLLGKDSNMRKEILNLEDAILS